MRESSASQVVSDRVAGEKSLGAGRLFSGASLNPGPIEQASGNGAREMVQVTSVSHCFPLRGASPPRAVKTLDDVSVRVPANHFVALVGPSGCGKTTLLNLLAGLENVQEGEILVDGRPPREGRSDTAYMLARDALLPWRTIEENVRFGLTIRREKAHAPVQQLLEEVGLGDFGGSLPRHLSQGMRQRAALARTFALDSELLLMDEPFGALDAQTKLQLQSLLTRLWERDRRTVVMVTHDLHEAIVLSDEILVMSRRPGQIKARIRVPFERPRDVDELLSSHEAADLYGYLHGLIEEDQK